MKSSYNHTGDHMFKKVAIISGGASGIGKAAVEKFRAQGITTYILDIQHNSNDPFSYACDIANIAEINSCIVKILKKEGKIDILVSNAGIHASAMLEETDEALFDQVMNINFKGTFFLLKAVLPIMRQQRSGKIVLVTSEQVFVGKPRSAIYGATKAALAQLAKSTAIDYSPFGICVNAICPGTIDTPLYRSAIERYQKKTGIPIEEIEKNEAAVQLVNRIGKPEEVASLIAFLCSADADYMTGGLYPIDGGYTAE